MITYLFNRVYIEDEDMKQISETINKYNLYFRDVSSAPIGKYSINNILETIEEALNYLEIYAPVIKKWVHSYLSNKRGELWLYYGLSKGSYLTDFWKIRESNFKELELTWPFLFKRTEVMYKIFEVDLISAQAEVLRQRARQDTSNPNYKPFHPDGCSSGCSCWMLDDMEQWYTEEQEEIKASKNIFFNGNLQQDFYKAALDDLDDLKDQWVNWEPFKPSVKAPSKNLELTPGQTPIALILSWIKSDYQYSHIFSMFSWSDIFKEVWEKIDSVDDFIKCQRGKLKEIVEVI
jgi:hypothetical protein